MTEQERELADLRVADTEHWTQGPPHEVFARLRAECPVHWSDGMTEYPGEAGYWSVTRADDIRTVALDWRTYSSWAGGVQIWTDLYPIENARAQFIAMDPPKHDRIKALFLAGFTTERIAEREPMIRAIVSDVLDRLDGRETCDLVKDVAQPVVARVIGEFVGTPREDDGGWARLVNAFTGYDAPELRGGRTMDDLLAELDRRCRALIEERRKHPSDDLAGILVDAEIDGERLSDEEIVMGIMLLMEAGNDSTKATYCSGMLALMEHPDQRRLLLEDPALIPGAVEESLRMFPAFSHFRRTATQDTELAGQRIAAGDKVVMWFPSSNRDEARYEDPDRFDVRRNPEHDAFGAGGRHFCLGHALARLELRVLFEETLRRYPDLAPAGEAVAALSTFVNQFVTLPVRLRP
ncbi:methyl-branched lipid omega-hydroxylase Cyp124 [Nocardioides maradonensis]